MNAVREDGLFWDLEERKQKTTVKQIQGRATKTKHCSEESLQTDWMNFLVHGLQVSILSKLVPQYFL